jgi:5'-methylthioadenosine phosphorylase
VLFRSRIGIIGGSGLYDIEGFRDKKWATVRTPFGAPSDQFLTGKLAGREIAFLPRHGRGHRILPSELNHRANLWAMKKLGVHWVISVSAVGSLQKKYRPCDIVLIDQFLDRTKQSANHTFLGEASPHTLPLPIPFAKSYASSSLKAPSAKKPESTTVALM